MFGCYIGNRVKSGISGNEEISQEVVVVDFMKYYGNLDQVGSCVICIKKKWLYLRYL